MDYEALYAKMVEAAEQAIEAPITAGHNGF